VAEGKVDPFTSSLSSRFSAPITGASRAQHCFHQFGAVDGDHGHRAAGVRGRRRQAPAGSRPLADGGGRADRLCRQPAEVEYWPRRSQKYLPYVFSLFTFILFANLLGLLPLALVGLHPFTATSHFR
jgi:hypothetical protein